MRVDWILPIEIYYFYDITAHVAEILINSHQNLNLLKA
jgi:hypothetical protein